MEKIFQFSQFITMKNPQGKSVSSSGWRRSSNNKPFIFLLVLSLTSLELVLPSTIVQKSHFHPQQQQQQQNSESSDSSINNTSSKSHHHNSENPHYHHRQHSLSSSRSFNSAHPHSGQNEGRGRNYWARDSYADAAAIVSATGALNNGGQMGGENSFGSSSDSGGGGGAGGYASASSMSSAYGAPPVPVPMSSYGAELQAKPAEPMRYYYQIMPSQEMMMSGSGWGMDEEDDMDSGGLSSILGGIAGIKGLKGLKGIKGLKALKLLGAPVLLPLLLPILLPILLPLLLPLLLLALLPLLLLLFIPIPIITLPNGRAFDANFLNTNGTLPTDSFKSFSPSSPMEVTRMLSDEYSRMFKSFLSSSECIERISCEIGRVSRHYKATDGLTKLVANKLGKVDSNLSSRIEKATQTGVKCRRYKCGSFFS